jgi:hypothetical protein
MQLQVVDVESFFRGFFKNSKKKLKRIHQAFDFNYIVYLLSLMLLHMSRYQTWIISFLFVIPVVKVSAGSITHFHPLVYMIKRYLML